MKSNDKLDSVRSHCKRFYLHRGQHRRIKRNANRDQNYRGNVKKGGGEKSPLNLKTFPKYMNIWLGKCTKYNNGRRG